MATTDNQTIRPDRATALCRLPQAIAATSRAVLWKIEERDGRPTKVPYCPTRPHERASVTDPATWGRFADAVDAHVAGKADGVGIVLGAPLAGVDIDRCRNPETGELDAAALDIVQALNSYTEVSPSGTGLHILVTGVLPPGGRRKGRLEMYSEARYFTVTGQHVEGTPTEIEERSAALAALHARVFAVNGHQVKPERSSAPSVTTDDAALLARARAARNGARFGDLYDRGDVTGHGGDESAADLALCNLLAFWTGADAGRMDGLYRQSALMRAKWDQRRGAQTYGERTIERAIRDCRETYTPGAALPAATRGHDRDTESDEAPAGLDVLLDSVISMIRKYVVVTEHQAVAIALWVAHTYVFDVHDCTPYLKVGSAMKRSGKTRLLEVLEAIVCKPWFTGRTSAAALIRKIDAEQPTLLLDESDAAFGGEKEYAEALRGVLNTGYRRSGKATVCIGQGAAITARDFRTYCPKAIAGIDGNLPDTVVDRCIPITLVRKADAEPCARWRERDGQAEGEPIRERLLAWAGRAGEILRDARPALPSCLGDRQMDVWEPLLAIADLAGGTWSHRARSAAIALSGTVEDGDIRVELLRDIRGILASEADAIVTSKTIVEALTAMEDRPWPTWSRGRPLTPHGLARLLKPLGIHVGEHWSSSLQRKVRAYRVDALEGAIARYLPIEVGEWDSANKTGAKPHKPERDAQGQSPTPKSAKTSMNTGVLPVSHSERGDGRTGGDDERF